MNREPLHAFTWLLWAVAAAASVQLAPNPVYVAVVVGAAALVVEAHGGDRPLRRAFPVLLAVGVLFGLVRVVLTALTTHGPGDVLFRLPALTLPGVLGGFTVGGTVEADVVVRAAAESLALVGILAAFGAFNAVVAHDQLVRAAPRAFHELGLVVTVALAFVPATVRAIADVREADRARTGGRVVRRGRLVRQLLPVLETGLERAVHLAESMDARGFGHRDPTPGELAGGWLALLGLAGLGASFVALVGRAQGVAAAMAGVGAAALVAAVVASSAPSGRAWTRYRRPRLRRVDAAVMTAAAAVPVVVAVLGATGDTSVSWSVPPVAVPPVNALALFALAALALPALVPPAVSAGSRRVRRDPADKTGIPPRTVAVTEGEASR